MINYNNNHATSVSNRNDLIGQFFCLGVAFLKTFVRRSFTVVNRSLLKSFLARLLVSTVAVSEALG